MKRVCLHLIVLFFWFPLLSQSVIPDWFEELPRPPAGSMYAVGFSGKYINQDRAREAAIASAVANMAKQIKTQLAFEVVELSDGRYRLLNPSFELNYDKNNVLDVFTNYAPADSSITGSGYFIIITYPNNGRRSRVAGNDKTWGNQPKWTTKLPRSKRYHYGVGIVSNYSSWVRAWKDADDYARFDLGKNVKIDARSIHAIERDNQFLVESVILRQSYDEEFTNTVIISRWYDQENDTYYSLCRQPRSDSH